TQITGLAPAVINYSNLSSLTVDGGRGGNTFTVQNTPANVPTNLNTRKRAANIDTVTVQATGSGSTLNINGQAGTDVVTIGNAGSVQGILGAVNVSSTTGTIALTMDDSLDSTGRTVTISATQIIGLAPAAITYANLSSLTVDGGTGGNTFTVQGTPANIP